MQQEAHVHVHACLSSEPFVQCQYWLTHIHTYISFFPSYLCGCITVSSFLSHKMAFRPILFRNWRQCSSKMSNRCFLSCLPLCQTPLFSFISLKTTLAMRAVIIVPLCFYLLWYDQLKADELKASSNRTELFQVASVFSISLMSTHFFCS